jgi:hypothetical protein
LSNPDLKFGQTETLSVKVDDGTAVTSAHWTYGDGESGDGVAVSHAWARPAGSQQKTFQVAVTTTLADGRTAQTSVSLTVNHPDTATVPNVVGQQDATAEQAIATAGLTSSVVQVIDNSIPVGQVISQSPKSGTVAWGSAVTLTVSSGPAAPWSMYTHACDSASWFSGAGTLACPGGASDNTGFVLPRPECWDFTDGHCYSDFVETHPQWVDNGHIRGDYTLSRPIIAADHFRTTLGFMLPQSGPSTATVIFRVFVDGMEVQNWPLASNNKRVIPVDLDLTPYVGHQHLSLEVDAQGPVGQSWACWVTPVFGP